MDFNFRKFYFVLFLVFLSGLSSFAASDVFASPSEPYVSSMTVSVPVPDKADFCGQSLDLKRYDLRERMDRELNSFTYFHASTLMLIKKANRYFPVIEPILKANGIPEDFKYLATIESFLDTRALSSANAAGIWQLVKPTAEQLGLQVDSQVDERYHIVKATEAACKYLRNSYKKYGNWLDVANSYNAGAGRINSELERQNMHSSMDLYLNEETSRYVFRILAIKIIMQHPYSYGFVLKRENLYKRIKTSPQTITSTIPDLASYADSLGISYYQLKDFNPWLRGRSLQVDAGKTYTLDIPDKKDLYYRGDGKDVEVYDDNWLGR